MTPVTIARDEPTVAPRPLGPGRGPVVAGAVLAGLAFVAYLPGLGRSLDFDSAETVGLFVRPGPPWAAFREQAVFNNHPLFSFLEQLVRLTTGRADAGTMRLLPIACGALAVGVVAWFAARRHALLAGVVAGAVLASNPTFVGLSRAVRGYSLLTLCAVVATIAVAEDREPGPRSGLLGAVYVLAAGAGLATHLYMVPVIAAHVGVVVARRELGRWRTRFGAVLLLGAAAYAGMAAAMVHASAEHARVFQPDFPWRVARMATATDWGALALAPLVAAGAWLVLRGSPAVRGATVALLGMLVFLWAGMQSSALEPRFFVWLVPGVAYLVAVAVGRWPAATALAAVAVVLAVRTVVPGYTADPTSYRLAAALVRQADAAGARSCVVDVGVPPMLAYLDETRDFTAVTRPDQLDGCDVVVVASWWPTQAGWYAADRAVIAAAEQRYDHRLVLPTGDPALVLSDRPLPTVG